MNQHRLSRILSLALVLFGFSAAKAAETRTYDLILPDGVRIPTTIVWKNIDGLDAISGNFHYAAGDLGFNGRNSSSGFIWMRDENGSYYEFTKQTIGKGFAWVGIMPGGGAVSLAPTAGKRPPAPPRPAGGAETRHYTHPNDAGIRATIHWENIKGLGAISGSLVWNGAVHTFTGRNPESGYINFTTSSGHYYELWKRSRGSSFEWAGTGRQGGSSWEMTLIPSAKGGVAPAPAPAPGPNPGNGETVRQYTMTGPYGQTFPATIIWSNIKGLGAIKGSLFSPGDNLTINGQNSRSGFIYFSDQYGTYYEMTKQAPVGGKVRWKGTARFGDGSTRQIELRGN